jgi:hypothetical protein
MTRNSSSLPLSRPPLPVHPSPTKTRDCLHLNPILLWTTHSSSWHSSRLCRPRPNSNNGPTERPPPPRSPLPHSTPPVLLRPAFPTIRFHGPTMRPPPPTPPLLHPGPRLGAPATLHPRICGVQKRRFGQLIWWSDDTPWQMPQLFLPFSAVLPTSRGWW